MIVAIQDAPSAQCLKYAPILAGVEWMQLFNAHETYIVVRREDNWQGGFWAQMHGFHGDETCGSKQRKHTQIQYLHPIIKENQITEKTEPYLP
jgi:hypothetical protein